MNDEEDIQKEFRTAMIARHNAWGFGNAEKFIQPFPQQEFRAGADAMRLEIIDRMKAEIETREKEMQGDEDEFGAIAALQSFVENLEKNFIYS